MKTTFSQFLGPLALLSVWSLVNILPMGVGAAVITFTNNTVVGDTSYDGNDIVVLGCTVTASGSHSFNSVQVIGGGVLTHPPTTTNLECSLQLSIASNLTVDASSAIDVSGLGYLPGYTLGNTTQGGSTGSGYAGSGGSYGGLGGVGGGSANAVYGDYRNPNELGSGGNTSSGGGLVRIAAGTVTIDGAIRANGASGGSSGGSGGGILLNVGTLAGVGSISANGGSASGNLGPGGGGGGRVAINYGLNNGFDTIGSVTAIGGASAAAGAVGTVYLNQTGGEAVLRIDSHGAPAGTWTPLGMSSETYFAVDRLVISGTNVVAAPQHQMPVQANNVTIQTGGVLAHQATTTNREYSLQLSIASNLTVDASSAIDVSGLGYLPGYTLGNTTQGGSTGSGYAGSGGSYGGLGGVGGGSANAVYGDYHNPNELGSGGNGSSGGGLVRITVGTVTIDGAIRANGASSGSSGGSGGGILLNVGTLAGAGSISANGGSASGNLGPGGGGGGRVAINYGLNNGFDTIGSVTAIGGASAAAGAVGTVYLNQTGGEAVLRIDSHGAPAGTWTPLGMSSETYFGVDRLAISGTNVVAAPQHQMPVQANNVTIQTGGVLAHQATTTNQEYSLQLSIASNLTVDASSAIDVSGLGYLPGYTWGNTTQGGSTGSGYAGSGGSYGGLGGVGGGSANAVYGDYHNPNELGSGGNGSSGGGLVRITAGMVTIDGAIRANGASSGSSGGSGGGILLNVGTLAGAGSISANGGSAWGNLGPGSGGGGRVAIYTWGGVMSFARANVTANGGTAGVAGAAGSVWTSSQPWFSFSGVLVCWHGSEPIAWFALGVNPNDLAEVRISSAGATAYDAVMTASGAANWNTTMGADGNYDLQVVFQDASGQTVGQISQNELVNNSVTWHGGVITADETWAAGTVHVVESNVTVPDGVTVTIQAGAIVKFAKGAGITVLNGGILNALGTADAPIIFTSLADDTAGGDTNLDGNKSQPEPGDWIGITVQGSGQFNGNGFVSVLYALLSHGGQLTNSETWLGTLVHLVNSNITVPAGVTLKINPGAVVKFAAGTAITVSAGGNLVAQGTVALPVTFTSINDDSVGGDSNGDGNATTPAAGDWDAIYISGGQASFNHVAVSYGAGNDAASMAGLISSTDPASVVVISNSVFSSGEYRGIYAIFGQVTAANCLVTGCDRGLQAGYGAAGQMTIVNCTVESNNIGFMFHGGTVDVANTIVANSLSYGVADCCGSTITSFRYCDVWTPGGTNYTGLADQTGFQGNISADPKFINGAQDDFRLNYGSPCIDAADGTVAPPTDIMGAPRYTDPRSPQTGLPCANGAYADIGAYEFVETATSDIDLIGTSVSGPITATAGQTVTVQWVVANIGSGPAVGPWHDTLYLAPESGAADPIQVGEVLSGVDTVLGPGQSYNGSATIRVPGGTEGSCLWQVHVNSQGDIFEGVNANNNEASSAVAMQLSVPALSVGETNQMFFAGVGVASWFKIQQTAGQSLEVDLNAATTNGACQIYVGYGAMPTTANFNLRSAAWNSPIARVVLPAPLEAQTTYLLVMPERIDDSQMAYTLSVRPLVFALSALGYSAAGNSGAATLPLLGSGFSAGMTVGLRPASGTNIAAATVSVVDSTSAEATFNLRGVAPGVYSVVADNATAEAILTNSFTVSTAPAGQLDVRLILPTVLRDGFPFVGYVEYKNTGGSDIPAALVSVSETQGTAQLWVMGGQPGTNTSLSFLTVARNSPNPGWLHPGADYQIPFQAKVSGTASGDFVLSVIQTTDPIPFDSAALEQTVEPQSPHPLWQAAWQRVFSNIGPTWGQYVAALDAAVTRAASYGLAFTSDSDVLRFMIQEAIEAVQAASVSGRVYLVDTNHPLGRVLVMLSKVNPAADDTNTMFASVSWYDGTFGVRNMTADTYAVSVDGFLLSNPMTITLADPTNAPITNLAVFVAGAAAEIHGTITDWSTGQPVTNAMLAAMLETNGSEYLAQPDATGAYSISNLPPGTYSLQLSAPGWLPQDPVELILAVGDSLLQSYQLTTGAVLGGVVSSAGGGPISNATVLAEWAGGFGGFGSWQGNDTTSDASGHFTLSGLPPGTYSVSAMATNLGVSQVTNVTLGSLDSVTNLNLQLASGSLLTGTVLDAGSGTPLSGVFLSLGTTPTCEMTTLSDQAGQFSFTNPPAGCFPVYASLDGYMSGSPTICVSQNSSVPMTVNLVKQGTLSGYVTSQGLPLANRTVTLVSTNGTYDEVQTTTTGSYGIKDIPPGTYYVYYGLSGGPNLFGEGLTISITNSAVQYDFDLSGLSLIGGHVLASDHSTRLTNAQVWLADGSNVVAWTATDTNGAYEFEVYQPGIFTVLAYASSGILAPLTNITVATNQSLLNLDFAQSANSCQVTVISQLNGQALSNAWVSFTLLSDPTGKALLTGATTGAMGTTVISNLPPGPYRVAVTLDGYAYTEQSLNLPPGQGSVSFSLPTGRMVQGQVTANGTAASNITVLAVATGGRPTFATSTDGDGNYQFSSLPARVFEVVAMPSAGYAPAILSGVDLTAVAALRADPVLSAAGTATLTGSTVDTNGQPMMEAAVSLTDTNGVVLARDVTEVARQFVLSNWPAGSFTLAGRVEGCLPVSLAVLATGGVSQSNVDLAFAPALASPLAAADVPHSESASLAARSDPRPAGLGDIFTASFWQDVYSGTMGIPDPLYYIKNLNIDWTQQNALSQIAVANLSFSCMGVQAAWNDAYKAMSQAVQAKYAWIDAYNALKQLNQADVQVMSARAALVAARLTKLAASTAMESGALPQVASLPYDKAEALNTVIDTFGSAISMLRDDIINGDFTDKLDYDFSAYGIALTLLEDTLEKAGVKPEGTDLINTALDIYRLAQDIDNLKQDVREGFERYMQAGDAYYQDVKNYKNAIARMKAAMNDCKTGDDTKPKASTPPANHSEQNTVTITSSQDPNQKVSTGYGAQAYVSTTGAIDYIIYFENRSNATAAAQAVIVTDPLDTNLDWSSFQFSQISFNNVTIDVPQGLQAFNTNVSVSTDPNPVQVQASLNPQTGLVTWQMMSIDPVTGQLVEDPLAGFLPPNDSTGRGDGFVSFSIHPKSGVANRTLIRNQASIVFDVNAPLLTDVVTNTIDAGNPASRVDALAAVTHTTNLVVSWFGTDTNSGVAVYDVYVAVNGGPWTLWLGNTTNTSAAYSASFGNTYAFYSIAFANAGNVEASKSAADASTQVLPVTPAGTYYGLIWNTNDIAPASSGFLTLSTTARSKYTAKLQLGGATYSLSGVFNEYNIATNLVKNGKKNLFAVQLQVNANDPDLITGSVINLAAIGTAEQAWTADITADRAIFNTKTNPAPQAGNYTLVIPGTNASSTLPAGDGCGTLTVSKAGAIIFTLSLADGTKLSPLSSQVSKHGQWPLYVPLYGKQGVLLSWITLTNAQTLGGELTWIKTPSNGQYYPLGFSMTAETVGSRYYSPGKGMNVLGQTSTPLTLTLEGGNLGQVLTKQFTLNAKNGAVDANGKKVNLAFTPATGLFTGSLPNPDVPGKTIPFIGVVLQDQTNGYGCFLGTNQSGQVGLDP